MSQAPMRIAAGFTQAQYFQALNGVGIPDPSFYATAFDDFTSYVVTPYTITATGNGAVARAAGKGGLVTFTTNSSSPATTDIVSLQDSVAVFGLTLGQKFVFTTSFTGADLTNPALVLGCIQTTTTPFTVTDGIWFSKASGSLALVLNHAISGVVTSTTTSFTLANAAQVNLGFYLNYKGEIEAYANNSVGGQVIDQNRVGLGPVGRIIPANLTTANLNPTLAVQSGTASSKVLTFDWFLGAMERQVLV